MTVSASSMVPWCLSARRCWLPSGTGSGVLTVTERSNGASASAPLDHITQPVLNRPHQEPFRHWQLAEDNTSTGVAVKGRRPSQYLTIVPKVRDSQLQMEVVPSGENELVNRIRAMAKRWRDDPGTLRRDRPPSIRHHRRA